MPGYHEIIRELNTLKLKIANMEIVGADVEQDDLNLRIAIAPPPPEGNGTPIYWAKITAVTDKNNYTADIWFSRATYSAGETGKRLRVWDIVETLKTGNMVPVIPAVPDPDRPDDDLGYDYECCQQLGILGDTIQP